MRVVFFYTMWLQLAAENAHYMRIYYYMYNLLDLESFSQVLINVMQETAFRASRSSMGRTANFWHQAISKIKIEKSPFALHE